MLVLLNECHDVAQQLAILFLAALLTQLLAILLDSPYCPQGYVGLLYFINLRCRRLLFHELAQCTLSRSHHQLEVFVFGYAQRQTRQGDEGVAGAALEPRIAGQQVAVVVGIVLLRGSLSR